ncbi:DUF1622 domain-containing protein [Pleurocapsa sp. PCC 7319]|uniref:DUF1622 domain-containing protein n=1 Tax=Pleurocapsa sp. PCC 7319 TaxID=118161 RepID=UPI00035D7D0E|nr:DUF1622 domain-containing protein [Pleurocapsa sp. PCC 7319]
MSFSDLAIATVTEAESANPIVDFNHLAEGILLPTAILLKIVIESIALLILALAIIKAVQKLLFHNGRKNREKKLNQVRLDLGTALALSLEFLLAADIAATAVSPSWDAVGKLAAITAIRTFLNFFLEKEVKQLAQKKLKNAQDRTTET